MTEERRSYLVRRLQSADDQAYLEEEKFSKDMRREFSTEKDVEYMTLRVLEYSARATARKMLIRLLTAKDLDEQIETFAADLMEV